MNVFEFEEVHCMSSGLGNYDGSVDAHIEQSLPQEPIYNINAKEASITEAITVEDSDWDLHFYQRDICI